MSTEKAKGLKRVMLLSLQETEIKYIALTLLFWVMPFS